MFLLMHSYSNGIAFAPICQENGKYLQEIFPIFFVCILRVIGSDNKTIQQRHHDRYQADQCQGVYDPRIRSVSFLLFSSGSHVLLPFLQIQHYTLLHVMDSDPEATFSFLCGSSVYQPLACGYPLRLSPVSGAEFGIYVTIVLFQPAVGYSADIADVFHRLS